MGSGLLGPGRRTVSCRERVRARAALDFYAAQCKVFLTTPNKGFLVDCWVSDGGLDLIRRGSSRNS